MRVVDIIRRKQQEAELTREEIAFVISGFINGTVPDYQVSALLMAIHFVGMSEGETLALTQEMLESGTVLDWADIAGNKVDKHSTGGVGDKTSLIVAPLAAAAGVCVPMISGRGLGHTGGTLDKLESIPRLNVRLDSKRFREVVAKAGCAITGPTPRIAPADRKLYALRDVTSTVDSVPLITASILSKKLAEGLDGLVLEVKESIEVLNGRGADDLRQLCLQLTAHMMVLAEAASRREEAADKAARLLDSGAALAKLIEMVRLQDGDTRAVEDPSKLPRAAHQKLLRAPREGYLARIDAEALGTAAMLMGAGREKVDDAIDPAVGLVLHQKLGHRVDKDEPLLTLHINGSSRLPEAECLVASAFQIEEGPPVERPLVRGVFGWEDELS